VEIDVVRHVVIVVGQGQVQSVTNANTDEGTRAIAVESPEAVLIHILEIQD
jgi:hypothetical protein